MDGDENDNGMDDAGNGGVLREEEIALRRNQLLMLGVVLLGILSICLAVSIPSDFEFNNGAMPSDDTMGVVTADSAIPNIAVLTNASNFSRKSFLKNPEDSVENTILRNIAIHKAIQELNVPNSDDIISQEEGEEDRIGQIVESFIDTEEFEDFIIDIEITDAIKRLREEKGYKKRDNTAFDDLFKQIETHFLGDNPNEVRLIRRVGEELEALARDRIRERGKKRSEVIDEEDFIAREIYEDLEKVEDGSGFEIDDV